MPVITAVDTYTPEVDEDTRPGNYYVTVIDGDRYNYLAGPFSTHRKALDMVEPAKRIAYDLDPKAPWYAYGTARTERLINGLLNKRLGI